MNQDPTVGNGPILRDNPTVEIQGKPYRLRHLSFDDMMLVQKFSTAGLERYEQEMAALTEKLSKSKKKLTKEDLESERNLLFFRVVMGVLADNQTDLAGFFASLIGVSEADFRDPEQFPIYSVIDIVQALTQHRDVKAFFTKGKGLFDAVGKMSAPTPTA